MDLFTVIGTCLRRWYVTLPLIVLAGYVGMHAYESVPPVYTSSVSIAVLPAIEVEVAEDAPPLPDNPYSGSGGPRFAAAVLARNINTSAYRELAGLEDATDIAFSASASDQQPMIKIEATGPTPESVLGALDAVTSQAGVVLSEFQTTAGAPESKQYRISPAVPADKVEDVTPSRWRPAGAILVVGLGLAAAVAVSFDALARRWRSRTPKVADGADTNAAHVESAGGDVLGEVGEMAPKANEDHDCVIHDDVVNPPDANAPATDVDAVAARGR